MARIARIIIPNQPHHLIQRGNRRQRVFFNNRDREKYLSLVAEYTKKENIPVWSYCLMDNHVHLVVVPSSKQSLVNAFSEIHKGYTKKINSREGWKGYLWQGRFISYPMDYQHTIAAIRYIERNPIKAGLVDKAEDYKWSSAKAHIYGSIDLILTGDSAIREEITDWSNYLNDGKETNLEEQIKKHSLSGLPLGSESFIEELEKMTGRSLKKRKPGPKPKKKN